MFWLFLFVITGCILIAYSFSIVVGDKKHLEKDLKLNSTLVPFIRFSSAKEYLQYKCFSTLVRGLAFITYGITAYAFELSSTFTHIAAIIMIIAIANIISYIKFALLNSP
jgi:uncharacterized membrane protein